MSLFETIHNFLAEKSKNQKLICVIGPTASGKTDIAVQISKKFDGEVVNADSRQTYTHLSIGTAKPTPAEMQGVPHHLFDFLDPKEECNVAEWRELAQSAITDIGARKKLPILCGGTGLFVNALTQNFSIPRVAPNTEFRQEMEKLSSTELWKKLNDVDPEEAERLGPHNKRYLIRALEIYEFSGKQKSDAAQKKDSPYDVLLIGVTLPRKGLYEKIELRAEHMKEMGFLEEMKSIVKKGYTAQDPALSSTGYREAIDFLQGNISEEEVWMELKKQTRNYAKRQLTWWRRDARVQWFDPVTLDALDITSAEF